MKKLTKIQIGKITDILKPFWRKQNELWIKFDKEQERLQREMSKEINLGIDLEFFYVDGQCVGIGASDFSERKNFPLIYDSILDE